MSSHGDLLALRRGVSSWRQARSRPAGPEPKCYQNLFLDRNQTMYLVLSSCTRYTDFQQIDFSKIYISRFFRAKTCQGTTQNMPRSSSNDPQNISNSTKNKQQIDICSYFFLYKSVLGPLKPCCDEVDQKILKFRFWGSNFRVHSSNESMFRAQSTSNIKNQKIMSFTKLS